MDFSKNTSLASDSSLLSTTLMEIGVGSLSGLNNHTTSTNNNFIGTGVITTNELNNNSNTNISPSNSSINLTEQSWSSPDTTVSII